MTGPEMVTMFNGLVDDKLDDTLIYQLFNLAKNEIESEREWEALKEEDSSNSIGASHTYLTALTLPTRFLTPIKLTIGDDRIPYVQIRYEDRRRYQDIARRWYLKMKDSTFFVCGKPQSGRTVYLVYVQSSADISASTSWTFPSYAHPLIPIKAAKIFYPVDQREKSRSYAPEWMAIENGIRRQLHMWDARLKKSTDRRPITAEDLRKDSNVVW